MGARRYERGMRWLIRCLLVLVLAGFGFVGVSSYAYRTPLVTADAALVIPPRTGAWGTLKLLHEAGVAPRPLLMALPVYASRMNHRLKAGEYEVKAGESPAQIIGKIARGEVVVHKVTIPEGWNIYQLRAALMAEPLLTGDLPPVIAEGSAFPDTVHFSRGEGRAAVLARMQQQQQEVLSAAWATRAPNLPLNSPEEALVLASIVEKETGVGDERALVAGVFINRLRLGMPLQTDPSVAYGVVVARGGAAMERALTTADLRADTPYNTYTRKGLPPTPICNPGRKAIEAVLNPAATDALYFVATGTGGHRFAATLAEHNRNVVEYRRAISKLQ